MLKLSAFFSLLCLSIASNGDHCPSDPMQSSRDTLYSIYVTKQVRPGSEVSVVVTLFKSRNPINVTARFTSDDNILTMRATQRMVQGESRRIILGVVPRDFRGSRRFKLMVEGVTDDARRKTVFVNCTRNFQFLSKSLSILIQTDKAIYQPGQTIKFRALCLDSDLRPLMGNVTYRVENSRRNTVLRNTKVLTSGVAGSEFELNRNALEGDWTITFSYKGTVEKITVTVKSYKLPKFQVKLSTPSVIYPELPGFTVSVKADYTFGQPVSGYARIRIELKNRYGSSYFPPRVINKKIMKFEGKWDVFIFMSEVRRELSWNGNSDAKIEVIANVTETLTSYTAGETREIDVKQTKVKVEVLSKPQVVKPGLLYKALLRVTEQDGKLLMPADRQNENLLVRYNYNYQRWDSALTRRIERVYNIPPNGLIWVEIEARDDNFTSISFNVVTNTTFRAYRYANAWSASRAESPSNSYIQITPMGAAARGELGVNDMAQFTIRATDNLSKYRVMVLARGLVVLDQIQQIPTNTLMKSFIHSFRVTSAMTPSITVLVSYVRPYDVRPMPAQRSVDDNEIVADSLKLDVSLRLRNQMSIMTNENRVDAGSNISIRVNTTTSGAFVGLRAIDQSVLLLKSGNDITKKRVVSELEDYSTRTSRSYDYFYFFSFGSKDAREVFSNIDMTVLTNALLFDFPDQDNGCRVNRYFGHLESVAVADGFALPGRSVSKVSAPDSTGPRTRNLFPETWLWTSALTETDGSVFFNATVPDTITSWELSAFSMSQSLGLGIAETQKLTVFRNFFVTLNLPLKITRGEIIIVQAIVFNYFDRNLQTNIQLLINSEFRGVELIQPTNNPTTEGPSRSQTVPAGGAISIKFPVRFNTTGDIPIRVMASSDTARDSVVRNVYVKPEGIPQCYSKSAFFKSNTDNNGENGGYTNENFTIRIPQGAVEGSGRVYLHTYGNILGSTMANLRKLLKAPTGCGEQNMLTFAPDVFVTLFLQKTRQLDEMTRKRAFKHIVDGYANQLRKAKEVLYIGKAITRLAFRDAKWYRRRDGSFSAFGEKDDAGSTWLTAFVVKCFIFARELEEDLVEKKVIDDALRFLLRQQTSEGNFKEEGKVIHRAMQGGVNGPVTMTAYVLITLMETQYPRQNLIIRKQVADARKYLITNQNQIENNKYALALVSYALYLVDGSRRESNTLLEELRVDNNNRWLQSPIGGSLYSSTWAPPYPQASSRSIETASYTLLNFFARNDLDRAIPLLRWVVSKQNDLGGYSSTQDTVIAIQALYKAAFYFSPTAQQLNQDLTLTATQSSSNFERRITINRENALVYNTAEVSPVNGDLRVQAEGTGIGIAQLSVCYNIPTTPYSQEPYSCSVNVRSVTNDFAMLKLCCTLNQGTTEPTGMFLYELELLNGFTVDVVNEERRNPNAKLIEVDQGKVILYYDELLPQQTLCAHVELLRVSEVASVKPATFKAYDYYEPEKIVVRTYNVDAWSRTGVCDVCGYECVGCPAPRLTDWNPWTPCVEFCAPESSSRDKSCYDPSLMKKIDFFRCGLEQVPIEKRACPKTFTCPDLSHGLWIQLPPSYRYYNSRICQVKALRYQVRRSPWTVIPGSTLNGNDQYIECPLSSSIFNLRRFARRFSISFLFKPNFFEDNLPVTVMSIGKRNNRPIAVFEKPIQGNSFRFVASMGDTRYFVENISLSALPAGRWSHVIVTWDFSSGGRVFINGVEMGDSITVRVGYNRKISSSYSLFLGRKPAREKENQGFVSGTFSALNIWNSLLPTEQILGLSRFYNEIRSYNGPEPLLSVRHLRSFAPSNYKSCFKKPNYLSRIYAKDASCSF